MIQPSRVPQATYRLQFSNRLRLAQARELVHYLHKLGVTDAYPSPLFRAREHSSHGYDVTDHCTIHPDLGDVRDFQLFAEELRGRGMGLLLDVVPNHMGVDDCSNVWWQDVLENGMASVYARYFDIDWHPPKQALRERVLLPFLGDQFGRVIENQELKLIYDDGRFQVTYFDRRFPLDPRSSLPILHRVLEHIVPLLAADDPRRMELESIITATENLPSRRQTDADRVQVRYREKEVIRRRIAMLYAVSLPIHRALDATLGEFNGQLGEPRSFDRLEALLSDQAYRLCFWRVASDEINYRRFFDINALAAVRVEAKEVFEAVHAMVFRFLEAGWITGLRIDHPDGLLDPHRYFLSLQERYRQIRRISQGVVAQALSGVTSVDAAIGLGDGVGTGAGAGAVDAELEGDMLYIAVEKILMRDEQLPAEWPVCGTTGYEFLNQLNALFVAPAGVRSLQSTYRRFTEQVDSFPDVLYESKRAILSYSMSSELFVLAGQLDRISEQHRWSRDFTRSSLHRALREVIACFPVYRTYTAPGSGQTSPEDQRRILFAIRSAKRRNPTLDPSFFDFIAAVLLLQDPDGISEEDRRERRGFVLKFQQVSGPVMAKGLEDTAFYRYYPLASLNEVGGEPNAAGLNPSQFHDRNVERLAVSPHAMSTTATHDTKRGEDLRARLNVLSEIPEAWDKAIARWSDWNKSHRSQVEDRPAPDANEEYLLYQTLVGTWPVRQTTPSARAAYQQRIVQYLDKALREAKLHTSWTNPSQDYEAAVAQFIQAILNPDLSSAFLDDFDEFVRGIADAGFTNSLAQTLLKICSPGVPDFYQGTEFWDFNLVDPDNRRPVDFTRREVMLDELQASFDEDPARAAADLAARWPDERIKLHVIWRGLALRRAEPDLFSRGEYWPIAFDGPQKEHACGLAREHDGRWILAAVPRFSWLAWQHAGSAGAESSGAILRSFALWWAETTLRLPPETPDHWRHVLTGQVLTAEVSEGVRLFNLGDLLARFPVALLEAE